MSDVIRYNATMMENSLYIANDDGGSHYPIADDGSLDAPCACNECRAGQRGELERDWGQGHFLCCGCPDELLWAEEQDLVGAIFTNNRWTWYVANPFGLVTEREYSRWVAWRGRQVKEYPLGDLR